MNPILQKLNQQNQGSSILKGLMNGNPDEMFNQMMRTNPKFAEFVNSNKGKSAEQIAREHGVDLNAIKNMLK